MPDTFERVRRIIRDHLPEVDPDNVKAEATIAGDLGADSLDRVELIMGLETEFGIDLPDHETDEIKTVGDAVDVVNRLTQP